MAHLYSVYCKVKERIHGETSHAISIKRCKCMSGWMDGYGLLLEIMAFLSRIIPISFFWDMVTLFSLSLFLGHASLACHLFSFWGNHNLTLFYFRNVLRERSPRHGAFINVENGWMVVLIPNAGMSQIDGMCTYLWSRKHKKHLTRVTQFDKTQQNIKQHMCKVFHGIWHMALVGYCISLGNLPF